MKAVRIHLHGGPHVLSIDEMDQPELKKGDIKIKVKAAALNHLDIFVREGIPGISLPLVMGSDAAGEIVECANDVTAFSPGDHIVIMPFNINTDDPLFKENKENLSRNYQIRGEHCDGVQAEYVVVSQDFVMKKAECINWQEAAAFPLVALTAYHMLVTKVALKAGQWILIHGASSGVGSAAIQIAKTLGANVIASTSSPEKVDLAQKLGADHVINYKEVSTGKTARDVSDGGVDVVFEHTGEQTWKESLRALRIGGKIVTCGATSGYNIQLDLRALFSKQQQFIGSTMGTRSDMLAVNKLV
ncbi:MAG: zinc-binding dehydrogenase, partial [Calditrichaeota bacterium]|nr:zinc-binding dehydrogenase [Calditrichota bacterium]